MSVRYTVLRSKMLQQLRVLQIQSSRPIQRVVEAYSRFEHCSRRPGNRTRLCPSRAIDFTAGLSWQTQFSRHTTQDRLCGVKIVVITRISTWVEATGNLTLDTTVMTTVECLHPLRGVAHTRLGGMMTGARMAMSGGSQSTHECPGLMQGPSLCRVWLTEAGLTEKVWTEITRVGAERSSLGPSVSAEPFKLLRFLPTSDWLHE
jgi:hypothetical protein